jgi:mannonate dehydratase
MITKHAMRWFGPKDPVNLQDIWQAGAPHIVTALHHIPVGEVWTKEEIMLHQQRIFSPLHWEVVESLPIHEDIKKGNSKRDHWINNYLISLENLAACGIHTVCYNFMPVLDWSRTHTNYRMEDGSGALRFDSVEFAAFDLFILKRPDARYSPELTAAAESFYSQASAEVLGRLQNSVLQGLPGSDEAFELEHFQSLLDEYRTIDAQKLKENLFYFIKAVAPKAQSLGIRLAIHPDDPPFPLLGLPRVVSTAQDLRELLAASPHHANGLTFCTGSLGVREDLDLPALFHELADRVHFLHLRTTKRENTPFLSFHEARHLEGDVNMFDMLKAVQKEQVRRLAERRPDHTLPMRPDHGHAMLDDLKKTTYPGYTAIGRLKALAELRGIEYALTQMQ